MKLTSTNNVTVPVSVVLGGNDLTLDEISTLGQGSIIELKSLAGEPVELYASGERIAVGEVVVIDENFGLRITEMSGE